MKKLITYCILLCFAVSINGYSQVGIGNASPQAALDITSTTDGLLIPRVSLSTTNTATVITPTTSEMVYNTATTGDVTPGYYYWDGTKWIAVVGDGSKNWALTGNTGTTPATKFIGTTDAQDLVFKTNNIEKMRVTSAGKVGIGTTTPATSALVDMTSTTAGFATPRMTSVQRKAIATPVEGLQVYDITLKGMYIYDGTKWDCANNPAGSVNYFANSTAPNGYLECNGQLVNRTTYAELFAAIGTIYGAGDGSTTFKIPDLRGEFVRGWDNGRGVDTGRVRGALQADDTKSHAHVVDPPNTATTVQGGHNHVGVDGNSFAYTGTGGYGNDGSGGGGTPYNPAMYAAFGTYWGSGPTNWTGDHQHTMDIGAFWSYNSGGTETRPRNVAMMACIKF